MNSIVERLIFKALESEDSATLCRVLFLVIARLLPVKDGGKDAAVCRAVLQRAVPLVERLGWCGAGEVTAANVISLAVRLEDVDLLRRLLATLGESESAIRIMMSVLWRSLIDSKFLECDEASEGIILLTLRLMSISREQFAELLCRIENLDVTRKLLRIVQESRRHDQRTRSSGIGGNLAAAGRPAEGN